MPREYLRDPSGRVLGSLEDNSVSGRIEARDAAGRRLGYYDKKLNETRDAAGHLISKGNVLPGLVLFQ
ncbi:hypothetical protein [Microvirga roseola]|uniref:hypothetical protein n=1 Tax=Microvirga roseola TaxID=2883126 RepID=UPI001E38F8C9|nr:hypothetical protein [Microvirga roseola]